MTYDVIERWISFKTFEEKDYVMKFNSPEAARARQEQNEKLMRDNPHVLLQSSRLADFEEVAK